MMPSSIYDLAIENNFPDEEALALYFLDDIPQKEQKKVLALLKMAIGRYKKSKEKWIAFKESEKYKKSKSDLKKYDGEYRTKIKAAEKFLSILKVKNIELLIDMVNKNQIPNNIEFEAIGDFSLSMKANIREELIIEILFQIQQWKLERKNWRTERLKLYPSQPNKKPIEKILHEVYSAYFTKPIGTNISEFLKTFN